jgi:hypothetical protein
MPRKIIVQG